MTKKKILFISIDLGGGGAERITSYIINGLSKNENYDVKLLMMRDDSIQFVKDLPGNVKIETLHVKGRTKSNLIKLVRAIIKEQADVCFTNVFRLNLMFALTLPFIRLFSIKRMRTIVRETNILTYALNNYNLNNRFFHFFYKHLYCRYDRVIAQSNDMRNDMITNWGIKEEKVTLINNPIRSEFVREKSAEAPAIEFSKDKLNYIAVGRIAPQKGYDIIIERMAGMGEKLNFRLYIAGHQNKDETSKIKLLIKDYGLEESVILLGRQDNPFSLIAASDGLLLPSRHEGFPNVLLEAGALGKPVFANHCPGGIDEIVIPGLNGYYCNFENQKEFEDTLNKYQTTTFDSEAIKESIESRFAFDFIMEKYNRLFAEELDKVN